MSVGAGGAVCRCGNRGCLELLAGGPALLAQVRTAGHNLSTLAELVALAQQGDPGCRRVLTDAGDSLGLAVANLVNLINPDRIVFGGELGLAGEMVLASLRDRLAVPPSPPRRRRSRSGRSTSATGPRRWAPRCLSCATRSASMTACFPASPHPDSARRQSNEGVPVFSWCGSTTTPLSKAMTLS